MPTDQPSRGGSLNASMSTILDDRACSSCGYSLKGLDAGGVCPECGEACATALAGLGVRPEDNVDISRTSFAFLLVLGIGLFLCGVSGIFVARFAHVLLVDAVDADEVRLGLAGSGLWVVAALILLRDRPRAQQTKTVLDDHAPWFIRLGVAISQPAWIAAAGFAHLELSGTPGAAAGKWIAFLLASLGAPLVPWVISSIAEWVGSSNLMNWLRNAAWCLAFGVVVLPIAELLWATKMNWTSLLTFPAGLAHVLWVLGMIGTSVMCFQLLIDVRWAIINARERAASQIRIAEKRRQYEASLPQATYVEPEREVPREVADLLEQSPSAPAPHKVYRAADEIYIEPAKNAEPYALEDTGAQDRKPGPP